MVRPQYGVALALLAWVCLLAPPARAVPQERIEQAMQRAVKYIESQQKNGNWEIVAKPNLAPGRHHLVDGWQYGGVTSVALCSLLYAGKDPQEKSVKAGIEWLKGQEVYGVYALGFRCQVWAMAPNHPGVKQVANRDKTVLLNALLKEKNGGFFGYYFDPKLNRPGPDEDNGISPRWDTSVSQYGVLGMWAISQLNIEISDEFWKFNERAWHSVQAPNGGWSYVPGHGGDWGKDTVSMTAAGLATLFITQERVHQFEGLECKGNIVDPHIEAALKWMNQNFRRFEENRPFYSLYGVERVGVASGYKYFGNLNWFDVGAEFLLRTQNPDGSWGKPDGNDNAKGIPDTAFALMFLARGHAGVMVNKLDYNTWDAKGKAQQPTWNQRPRDAANIARWSGKNLEHFLNWQVVSVGGNIDDWHDAPILWLSGRDELNFKPEEQAKLRQFVEEGGLIFGNPDCGRKAFADSFQKLGQALFPTYEFRELPATHPIYTSAQFRRDSWPKSPFMLGLSNGVRELMILAPGDFGRTFQVQSFAGPNEPMAQAFGNLYVYATDHKVADKGISHILRRRGDVKTEKAVKVARLQYAANWNPEPAGWRRLEAYMANNHKTALQVETVALGEGKLVGGGYILAHLTGTTRLHLSEAQQKELKEFVDKGGTLLIDAAGGSPEFALTAEAAITGMFAAPTNLAASHPIFSAADKIGAFEYRTYARKLIPNAKGPRLKAVEIKGRARVIFSAEDLSAGLTGKLVDGIYGYDPRTATSIVADVAAYSIQK